MEGNSIVDAAIAGVRQSAFQSGMATGGSAIQTAVQGATAGHGSAVLPESRHDSFPLNSIMAGSAQASAAAKLNEVISVLTIKSALSKASKSASSLSSVFSGANGNLAGSWANVSEFANTINKRVEELIKRFSDELQAFAAMTEQNEQEITTATNNANDLASNILSELGL